MARASVGVMVSASAQQTARNTNSVFTFLLPEHPRTRISADGQT